MARPLEQKGARILFYAVVYFRLVSLRMGNIQYNEVPTEYGSLLVENYTNALRSVRKCDLEFM